MKDFFIAVYTHEVKSYCDVEFFHNIANFTSNNYELHVVDNTDYTHYTDKLRTIITDCGLTATVDHIITRPEPKPGAFHMKVLDSVNFLRDKFLQSSCKYFLIIESDVVPPIDCLERFEEVIDSADIIGGIYYRGHHKDEWFNEDHKELIDSVVYSGCTLYKRNVIEQIPFNLNYNNLGMFPDTVMDSEAKSIGFSAMLYTWIKCDHMHTKFGSRQHIRR